jgi:hypothetical protein
MAAFLAFAPTFARANVQFEQCEWGFATPQACIVPPTGSSRWVTGNPANAGAFREGDFVPTRVWFNTSGGATDVVLSGHSYTLIVGYDATQQNGFHAYDYLGTYNASRPPTAPAPANNINPCSGVPGTTGDHMCGSAPSTAPVPLDENSHNLRGAPVPPTAMAGVFSAWGATFGTGAAAPSFVNCPNSSPANTQITVTMTTAVARCIALTFTVAGPVENTRRGIVIAWGAHIATEADWGPTTAALRTSGADFHQRVQETPQFPFGNKTLPLATIQRPGLTTSVSPRVIQPGGTVTDTATLTGRHSAYPRGSVEFFVCGPTDAPISCADGKSAGHPEVVVQRGSSEVGTATIMYPSDEAPAPGGLAPGFYCFRVVYTPAPGAPLPSLGAPFLSATHSNNTTECFQVAIATLIVNKICTPPGHFNLHIRGGTVDQTFEDVACNEGFEFGVPEGTYTVSESAGTGTNPADFDPPEFGSTCPNGSVTLTASETVTCTITNFRKAEPRATLTVKKTCDPATDTGVFVVLISGAPYELRCGQDTGTVDLPTGTHTVTEEAGPNTSLSNYHTAFSGACTAANGSRTASVHLTENQSVTCTITNTRHGPATAVLTVVKHCTPAHGTGQFVLDINEREFPGIRCGHGTGPITLAPGAHLVGEVATPNVTANYVTRIGGDCAADGTITLRAGEHATCTVTNISIHALHPARPTPRPPHRPPRPVVTG